MPSVLVCSGCYDKIPLTGWLKQLTFFSQSSGGCEVQDQGASGSTSCESFLPALQTSLILLCPPGDREGSGLSSSFYKDTNPIMGPHPHGLIQTSKYHHNGGKGFNTQILKGHKHSVHNNIICLCAVI